MEAAGFPDRAVAGSSALQAALQRELRHEVAAELGLCTGRVYWDMAKFYDTLDPEIVVERAVDLGFPLRVLVLGMMVHQSARSLKAGDAYSAAMLTENSILAGCGLSVAWTRAVLHAMLDEAHKQYLPRNFMMESWVDDLASVIQGTADQCIEIATRTGESIAKAAAGLKLVILGKSRAVFNRPGVAKQVAEQL